MENLSDFGMKNLVNELTEGRELAKQLQIHLNVPSSSRKTREILVDKILNSYDQALSMLKYSRERQQGGLRIGTSDSPRSLSASPRSDGSDHEFKDQDTKEGSKKRNAMSKWSRKIQVVVESGSEGHVDNYSWRKYGQKDILGANHPRSYFRCTHRYTQGCLATKQVQKSDDDPTVLDVTYKGRHTCNLGTTASPSTTTDQEPNNPQPHQNQPQLHSDLQTQDLDTKNKTFQPLNNNPNAFSSNNENGVFPASMMDNSIYSSSFLSLEPNYSAYVPSFMSPSESNAPNVGIDFPFGQLDLDSNFQFDENHGYFPN